MGFCDIGFGAVVVVVVVVAVVDKEGHAGLQQQHTEARGRVGLEGGGISWDLATAFVVFVDEGHTYAVHTYRMCQSSNSQNTSRELQERNRRYNGVPSPRPLPEAEVGGIQEWDFVK